MKNLLNKDIALYKELIDNANVMIDAFDADGNILIWNKMSEEITGYKEKEVIGNKKVLELLYPDPVYRKDVLSSVGAGFKKDYKNVEFVLLTKYGEKKRISWSVVAVKNKKGAVIGSFGIGIDITLKSLVKERERESFRALLKSVRYHEDIKQQYEDLIKSLKQEVNSLLKELARPPKY